MLKNGAEIYRVEDTITRICRACKIPYAECFATTTGIFLSIDSGNRDDDMHTFIKRIHKIGIDLEVISKLNEFSRVFTTTNLSIEDAFVQLREIEKTKPYNLPLNILAAALIGSTLSLSFGASPIDAAFCALITVATHLVAIGIEKLQFNPFIQIMASCSFCTLMALIVAQFDVTMTLSPIIIASITIFLPGVAITNAARDMLSGDMLAGVSRFAEALIKAIAIAVGVGAVLKLWSVAGGTIPPDYTSKYPIYMFFIFAFFTTLGFCLRFHVPKKHLITASLIGALGFTLYKFMLLHDYSNIFASFLGACLVATLAEFGSRAGKDATTLFIIPGIIPLVPGTGMYETMQYLLQGGISSAAAVGSETFMVAGSIAIALVITASITRVLVASTRKIKWAVAHLRSHTPDEDPSENSSESSQDVASDFSASADTPDDNEDNPNGPPL